MPQSLVEIDNPGNMALEACDDLGVYWFLVIRTLLGESEILSFGPLDIDSDTPLPPYTCSYEKFQYNQRKLNTAINRWLNDKDKALTSARVIEMEEAFTHIPDIYKFIKDAVADLTQGDQ